MELLLEIGANNMIDGRAVSLVASCLVMLSAAAVHAGNPPLFGLAPARAIAARDGLRDVA